MYGLTRYKIFHLSCHVYNYTHLGRFTHIHIHIHNILTLSPRGKEEEEKENEEKKQQNPNLARSSPQ